MASGVNFIQSKLPVFCLGRYRAFASSLESSCSIILAILENIKEIEWNKGKSEILKLPNSENGRIRRDGNVLAYQRQTLENGKW